MNNISKMPGVNPEAPKINPHEFDSENGMMMELKELIEKYNGTMSNVAMVGCIQVTQDMLTFNLMIEQGADNE